MFDFYAINNRQATLKNARAYCESGTYYLKLAYEYEDKDGTHQLIYPKVSFPFPQQCTPCIEAEVCIGSSLIQLIPHNECTALLGDVTVRKSDGVTINTTNVMVSDVLIKPKVHKMTIKEIEKELGYKVEIVSEKGDRHA